MKTTLLTKEELESFSQEFPEWEILEKKIRKVWIFKNFIEAFGFMTKVAIISESMNHHPEFENIYNKVSIKITTHDLGGLSTLDIALAESINGIENLPN